MWQMNKCDEKRSTKVLVKTTLKKYRKQAGKKREKIKLVRKIVSIRNSVENCEINTAFYFFYF